MQQAGFDLELADKMLALNAWQSLHNDGQIEHPSLGVSIDVSTAWERYQFVKFGTLDPYPEYTSHTYADCDAFQRHHEEKMLRLMNMSEEDRKRRQGMPKKKEQLAQWLERQGEPEETFI